VARLKVSTDLQVSALVRAAVTPRLRQAARTLSASGRERSRKTIKSNCLKNKKYEQSK